MDQAIRIKVEQMYCINFVQNYNSNSLNFVLILCIKNNFLQIMAKKLHKLNHKLFISSLHVKHYSKMTYCILTSYLQKQAQN